MVADLGANVSAYSSVKGSPPFTHQWFKDGIPLSGQTNDQLVFGMSLGSPGSYQLIVRNPWAAVTSSVFTVSLTPPLQTNFTPTFVGRILTIGPGSCLDVAGNVISFSGGSIALVDPAAVRGLHSYTNHIYLIDGELMGFSRNIHRGGIYLGAFVSTSTGVTAKVQPADFGFKSSRLPQWLAKQGASQPRKVYGFGDSILNGFASTGGSNFFNLSFNPAYAALGLTVPDAQHVTSLNYGTSGASILAGLAFTGELVAPMRDDVGALIEAAAHRTEFNNLADQSSSHRRIGIA
ncbi:MAG TPA: immunoglobulin domain-containing protein, partial [Candidatus Limnocylindria bacterium]|nr:immunoglobulin domain-containing protein [Candidatus Limnocylindria bacterium]